MRRPGARDAVLAHVGPRGEKGRIKRFNAYFAELMKTPMQLGWFLAVVVIAVAAVFLLAVFVYYIYRTGNSATTSSTELAFRNFLENTLVIRPRTKEMIVGWPMLLLFIWSLRRGMKFLPMVFGLGMTIGLVSVVNTFLHIRTPFLISLLRHRLGRAVRPAHRPRARAARRAHLPRCAPYLRGGEACITFSFPAITALITSATSPSCARSSPRCASAFRNCSLTVLSHDPAATREKYGVEAVERMSPLAIARAVRRCDMLISGGGSLLQDVTSSKSLHYYLAIIRFAQLLGKKVFIYSQGIGPIEKDADRRATARALRRADGIVVRDERSAALLAEIGVPAERVVITADPVIRMKKTDRAVGETILRRAGVTQDGRPVVGWAIRERNRDSRFVAEVLRSIRWLKETYNAQSVLIPFHYEEDGEVCRHIASQLPDDTAVCLDEKYLSEDMLSIIGCMDLLVGVRLHSLIYAAIMGVPLIGISYDPKCTAFLNSVGLDKLSTRDGYTAEAFETEAARVLANGAEQTACVKRHMDELSRKLDTNEEMICAIMKDEKKTQPSAPRKSEKSGVRTAGAISIVFLLTLFAKLLGVVREMVQANIFGTGVDANLYTASYNSTLYLFTTVCYALCIAAVPILTKEFAADRRRGERAANNLMTVTLLGALVVVAIWQILASTPLVGVLWDTDASELPRLVSYIRIMTCALPVVAAAYLNVAIFQATDHYELQGSMSIPYNAFLAVFLLTLGARWGILGVVIASSCAWLLQLGMSIPYARKEHYVYRPGARPRGGLCRHLFQNGARHRPHDLGVPLLLPHRHLDRRLVQRQRGERLLLCRQALHPAHDERALQHQRGHVSALQPRVHP